MKNTPKIYVALPVMDEVELLYKCLHCVESLTFFNFHVVICVNQPEEWWDMEEKKKVCENNAKVLERLSHKREEYYTIIDKSSKGNGWQENKKGIGWARKTIMDYIAKIANDNDIILSLDADTTFDPDYFPSVIKLFSEMPGAAALSNPYYHRLIEHEPEDRAILRYEIYMRNYASNLLMIGSPYAFTALGSAIALPVSAYKAIGGLTPKNSGEDFYFLQKLRKYGNIIIHNKEWVYPAARFSDRVLFGTGPAMIKGNKGDWDSYPVYHHSLFNNIKKTYDCFPALYKTDCDTPMTEFLQEQFNSKNIWQPIRENHTDEEHFIRACHEKVDGLKLLQYLKSEQKLIDKSDEVCLYENISELFVHYREFDKVNKLKELDFKKCSVDSLLGIRNYLFNVEEKLQEEKKFI